MKKVVITYGLIAGAIVAVFMFITMPLVMNGTIKMESSELVGYTTMMVALSMIFFGVKSYRDNYKQGVITFWDGCKIGLLITLVAGIMYALAWEVCYTFVSDDFMQKMTEAYVEKLRASGASAEEMQKTKEQWENLTEMYKNPIIRFGITFMEIAPVGIVITLISAGLFRMKQFFPATQS